MSSNPNLQKIGKRKNAAPKQQADWLFPSTEKNGSASAPKSQAQGRSTSKQDKQLAKDLLKRRADGNSKTEPPSQLMAIVSTFLSENEFDAAAVALQTGRRGGLKGGDAQDIPSLTTIYNEWLTLKARSSIADGKAKVEENGKPSKNTKQAKGEKKKTKTQDSGSDIEMIDAPSSSSPSSSSSSSSSSSDSDADDEKEIPVKASSPKSKPNSLKRKAASSSGESTTSDSDSDSSSEDEAPKFKKMKMKAPSSSESSESSDSDSSSAEEASEAEEIEVARSTSGSESSHATDSDSSESDSSTNSIAQKTPLPASDDSSKSDTDSDSDSSSASEKPAVASESSATLGSTKESSSSSSEPSSSSDDDDTSDSDAQPKQLKVIKTEITTRKLSPPLPPDPVVKKPFKKTNVPFSRIPKDIKVDERLASNAYVPYDYAQKAHEDLIVTRGKGFTKEKNKKKRGSYRGGYIDVEGKKGIKFED